MNIIKLITILFFIPKTLFAEQGSNEIGVGSFLLFPFLFLLMYVLLIRPQSKKSKEHKNLIDNLKINDEIVTNGGIVGKIIKISDQFIIIAININTNIIVKKESVAHSLPKGTMKQIT